MITSSEFGFNFEADKEYLIDPPQGWLYGFPKPYIKSRDGDIVEWLLRNGCPKENLKYCRIIYQKEKE